MIKINSGEYRFPFDRQTCHIELIFTEYPSEEVFWKYITLSNIEDPDTNPAWKWIDGFPDIDFLDAPQLMEGKITYANKSVFSFSIVLDREPRTAIVYIIMPTIAITIFNLISLLLPSGEGN